MGISQGILGVQLMMHSAMVIHEVSLDIKCYIKSKIVTELKNTKQPVEWMTLILM